MAARGAADDFGVPLNIMGGHPEEFFSIMGRIVTLSASLEHQVLGFYQCLVGRDQNAYIDWPVAKLIRGARKELKRLPPEDAEFARQWLREADAIRNERNKYVHNMWPAQGGGGRLFGWRQGRNGQATITTKKTMADMRADLDRLVALLEPGARTASRVGVRRPTPNVGSGPLKAILCDLLTVGRSTSGPMPPCVTPRTPCSTAPPSPRAQCHH
jgi:hypothetical protein